MENNVTTLDEEINVTDIDKNFNINIRENLKIGQHNNNISLFKHIKNVIREVCMHCKRQIYTHNPVIICHLCSNIIHYKCARSANYKTDEHNPHNWYCTKCQDNTIDYTTQATRYNPITTDHMKDDPSHHYDYEHHEWIDSLQSISKILNECKSYDINEFNAKFKSSDSTLDLSMYFLNIDGNASNFNSLEVELNRYEAKFSVIGLCETNIDSINKDLYALNDYTSVYQSKIIEKKSGSGLGLYVHNKYSFNEMPDLSTCTPNLETFFINITSTAKPITVGVVYRPHTGTKKLFLEELENILNKLPKTNVYILGDYNMNLHEIDNEVSKFEQLIFSTGYAPTISLATHER